MRARSLCSIDILHGSLWHVTRVMSSWLAHLVHCHHPASVSDQMTTNCHQSQKNSGKISTRIIFVRQTGVIYTSHTWVRQCSVSNQPGIISCHVLSRVVITVLAGWAPGAHHPLSQAGPVPSVLSYQPMSAGHLSSRSELNIFVMKTHPSRYRFMIGPLRNWVLPSVITSQM